MKWLLNKPAAFERNLWLSPGRANQTDVAARNYSVRAWTNLTGVTVSGAREHQCLRINVQNIIWAEQVDTRNGGLEKHAYVTFQRMLGRSPELQVCLLKYRTKILTGRMWCSRNKNTSDVERIYFVGLLRTSSISKAFHKRKNFSSAL